MTASVDPPCAERTAHLFNCVNSLVGRPRLFERDGRHYLAGRNRTQPPAANGRSPMQLCWFRFLPETLALETCVVLSHSLALAATSASEWQPRNLG